MAVETGKSNPITNQSLLIPYAAPYFAYVGIASLSAGRISPELAYTLKIIIVPILLVWAWKWFVPVRGPKSISGSVVSGLFFGLAGLAAWCLLLAPFVDVAGEPWDGTAFWLRLFSASLIVPVFEEMFIRGYFLRTAYQWDLHRRKMGWRDALNEALDRDNINHVPPGAWSVPAVLVSTIAFSAGHLPAEWPAAVAYSLLMSVLWIIRKDLLSCIIAHGVTNFALGVYVAYSGHWGLW